MGDTQQPQPTGTGATAAEAAAALAEIQRRQEQVIKAVLVIAGPLLNRYVRRLMLRQAQQHRNDAPQAAGSSTA
jgi:hypothetical protein